MTLFKGTFLDRLGAGEGLWLMALIALLTMTTMLTAGKIASAEFVACFQRWLEMVFGAACIAGFRDWKKNGNGTPPVPLPDGK